MKKIAYRAASLLSLCAYILVVAACSGDGSTVPPPETGATVPETGTYSAMPPDASTTCKLSEVTDATPVAVEFVNLAPPSVVAPTMTGGDVIGRFRVIKARVYLPKETASYTDPPKSTGTIRAWSVFEGSDYRIHIDMDLVVKAKLGEDQTVKQLSDSQGKVKVDGAKLTFDQSCDPQPTAQPEYSFTHIGTAVTILIKAKVGPTNSDSYTELQAVPD
jgi:hypothetical protein